MIFLTLTRALSPGAWRRVAAATLLLLCGTAQADAVFGGSAVSGCTYVSSSKTYSCTYLPSGYIAVNSGYTVNIAGSASMGSAQIDGSLNIGGSLDVAQHSIINGNISVAGAATLDNQSSFNGSLTVGGSVAVGNQSEITGNLNAGGDISIDNHAQVDGNLSGNNVVMNNAQTKIGGNASVRSITIGNKGEVDGTITCTAPGASGCSCVTDNSGNGGWAPSCSAAPPPGGPDHIQITHSGSGLTCQPATVTITVCANAACSATYAGSTTVTLQPGGQQFTITGGVNGNGSVAQSTVGNATISAASVGINNPSTCVNTGTGNSSCIMNFATAGLNLALPLPPNNNYKSGETQSFTLSALQSNPSGTACVAALANTTRSVNFQCGYLNPANTNPAYPAALSVNNVGLGDSSGACSSAGSSVNLTFDANGAAQASMTYADVGQMKLLASMTLPQTPNQTMSSNSASFIVAPYAFKFFATQSAAPNKVNPEPIDASGAAFIGAGQLFGTQMAAVNKTNGITRNFGRESPAAEYVGTVTPQLLAPAGGAFPGLFSPNGSAIAFPAMSNGETASVSMYFNEVGIVQLSAQLHNPAGYLGSGIYTSGSTNIGRFIPDHFNTAITSLQMNCSAVTSATQPCPVPNTGAGGKFLYSHQPFDLSVTAYSAANASNASGAVTTNYAGSFAKSVAITAWNADPAALAVQNPPAAPSGNAINWNSAAGISAAAGFAATAFTSGVANSATYGIDSHPEYDFAKIYPAADNQMAAPVSLYLRATDSDGATSLLAPNTSEALVSVVSGRLLVGNTYGSPLTSAPVKVTAQYWTGSAYATNPAYASAAATPLAATNITFSNCILKTGAACAAPPTLISGTTLNFIGGGATFSITPVSGVGGAVDIQLLSNIYPLIYLPSTTGRATFGVYRSGPVVYMREVF